MKTITLIILSFFLCIPGVTFAHQPRIPEGDHIIVIDPEISKAYYTQLQGSPQTYTIDSSIPFSLYVNILAPYIVGQKKDIIAQIIKDGDTQHPLAILDGNNHIWTVLEESFGYDTYWVGPEYKAYVGSGRYQVIVSNPLNDAKYSLAIGEAEVFDLTEIRNALTLVPKIKRDFFDESPMSFIFSPFGWGLILMMFFVAGICAFLYRLILTRWTESVPAWIHRNTGQKYRLLQVLVGSLLLIGAITTSWSPLLLFFSGFLISEAILP